MVCTPILFDRWWFSWFVFLVSVVVAVVFAVVGVGIRTVSFHVAWLVTTVTKSLIRTIVRAVEHLSL